MAKEVMGILVVLGLALTMLMACAVSGRWELEEELVNMQGRSKVEVIHLDNSSLEHFTMKAKSRSYSLVIFFDVVQRREEREIHLDLLRTEFELVASAFIKNNRGQPLATKVFFCDIKFEQSYASHVGPGITNQRTWNRWSRTR